jgi:hypothetical protein
MHRAARKFSMPMPAEVLAALAQERSRAMHRTVSIVSLIIDAVVQAYLADKR